MLFRSHTNTTAATNLEVDIYRQFLFDEDSVGGQDFNHHYDTKKNNTTSTNSTSDGLHILDSAAESVSVAWTSATTAAAATVARVQQQQQLQQQLLPEVQESTFFSNNDDFPTTSSNANTNMAKEQEIDVTDQNIQDSNNSSK